MSFMYSEREIVKRTNRMIDAFNETPTNRNRANFIQVGAGENTYQVETVDIDEVYPNLFICNQYTAQNKRLLKDLKITNILNCADGKGFGMVQTGAKYYEDINIKYLGLRLMDFPTSWAAQYFDTAAEYIHSCLMKGGRVAVHCQMGISRASTMVIAYLMIKQGLTGPDAITLVKKRRNICPNPGFMKQLGELDFKLRKLNP